MVEFTYYGHSCFMVKGKKSAIVTDPYNPQLFNLSKGKIAGDVILIGLKSSEYHNYSPSVTSSNHKNPFIISGPGEYEIENTVIVGIAAEIKEPENRKNGKVTLFQFYIDGLSVVHLSTLGKKLNQSQLEGLGNIDVAIVPVGGKYSINAKEAVEIIAQIEPKVVIPSHFRQNLEKLELDPIENFLSQMGAKEISDLDKLSISNDKLPEETQIIILKRSN